MQRISRAPVLSATRSRDSCWITLLGLLEYFGEAPVLRLRERAGLDDAHEIADLRRVLLVVGVELRRAPDDLLVFPVRLHGVDLDHDRLVHRVGDDHSAALLTAAARVLRLGQADDRLALGRALAPRLDVLVALRAREPLALRLGGGPLRSLRLALGLGDRLLRRGLLSGRLLLGRFIGGLFGRGLLGGLFGRGLLGRRLCFGLGRLGLRGLLDRLDLRLVLLLVFLVRLLVRHWSLSSGSSRARCGSSGCARSRAWPASVAPGS